MRISLHYDRAYSLMFWVRDFEYQRVEDLSLEIVFLTQNCLLSQILRIFLCPLQKTLERCESLLDRNLDQETGR